LQCIVIDEGLLYRVQRVALRETFDGRDAPGADIDRSIMQAQTGKPSSQTVQAEQAPRLHAILVPVRPKGPRSASASVMLGSARSVRVAPLTSNVIGTASGPTPADPTFSACDPATSVSLSMVAPAVVRAEPRRKERRDRSLPTSSLHVSRTAAKKHGHQFALNE